MIEFLYDMDLCGLIVSQQSRLAEELIPIQVLPVAERFRLRQADLTRRKTVSGRLNGLSEEHIEALRILLTLPLR